MDNFAYRKKLLEPALIRQLSQRSNKDATVRLIVHIALIAIGATMVWLAEFSWWLVPAWIFYGTVLMFLFSPLHECIHRTAFRNRTANYLVATVIGFLIMLPANYFRNFHFAHHRYTNDPKRDPELLTPKPASLPQYLWAMCGLGAYWWVQLRTIVRHSLGSISGDFIAESNHRTIILEARLHLVLYLAVVVASVLFETTIFFFYWFIPALIGTVGLRLFLHAEHAGCELSDNMLRNTRTTLTNPAIKLLSWNMPYHCEHHVFPAVPFHQLPALHQHLKDHLAVVSNGYYRFHREFVDSI